jgi:predicted lipoprotein with Yx(FWY)xxD motif
MPGWKAMAAVLSAAALGGVLAAAALPSGGAGTVKAASNPTLGKVLVTASGLTLYHYTPESKGTIKCTGSCASLWPPLYATTKPVAGPGISAAKLSTIKRPDGKLQVTYAGFALYRYSADKKPGDANGEGLFGKWYGVTPAGTLAKASSSGRGYGTPPPTTTTTGGGYSYGP